MQEHVYSPLSISSRIRSRKASCASVGPVVARVSNPGVFSLGTAARSRQRGRCNQADHEASHRARPARRAPYPLISAAARMRIVLATIMTVATGMSRLVWPDSRNPEYR